MQARNRRHRASRRAALLRGEAHHVKQRGKDVLGALGVRNGTGMVQFSIAPK